MLERKVKIVSQWHIIPYAESRLDRVYVRRRKKSFHSGIIIILYAESQLDGAYGFVGR